MGALAGEAVLITGGASGLGRAIVERYASEGLQVAVADIRLDEAEAAAKAVGRNAFAVELDVSRQDSIDAMVERVVAETGQIDVLVNSAGIFSMLPLLDITRESYAKVFAVNVEGLLFTLQAVARQMVQQGRGGKIINLASQAGRRGERLGAAYCATKAAVISLTQSAGLALIQHRINVNAIAPGIIDTPMWDVVDREFAQLENLPIGEKKRRVSAVIPIGRMGQPEEVAGCAVFLASEDSDYVVAQTYGVDGGNWMA